MARIRSIHPGLFTDEDFAVLSPPARLLLIGIWVECDDKGCIPWKPLTIKMRIFPGDTFDIDPLLLELCEAGWARKYEHNGKLYGALKNFRVYQSPKKPNDVHPLPDELRSFVGLKQKSEQKQNDNQDSGELGSDTGSEQGSDKDGISSEPVRNQFGNLSLDGVGKGEGKGEGGEKDVAVVARARERDPPASENPKSDPLIEREQVLVAMGHDPTGLTATGQIVGRPEHMVEFQRWKSDLGLSMLEIVSVIDAIRIQREANGKLPPNSFSFYTEPMRELARAKASAPLEASNGIQKKQGSGGSKNAQFDQAAAEFQRRLADPGSDVDWRPSQPPSDPPARPEPAERTGGVDHG